MDPISFGGEVVPISFDRDRVEIPINLDDAIDGLEFWPRHFFEEFVQSRFEKIDCLRLAIRSAHKPTAFQKFLFQIYCGHFRRENADAVQAFNELSCGSKLLAVHVSCQDRIASAFKSVDSFGGDQNGLRHLIVIGHADRDPLAPFSFDRGRGLLSVPAADTYEGLPQKMASIFQFLAFSGNRSAVLKLDDDVHCNLPKFSVADLAYLTEKFNYLGRVNKSEWGIYRWWHFKKCEDVELNRQPYSMIIDCDYANGPAYLLSPLSVNILGKSSIYLSQHFESEYYEDLAVAKVLKSFGVLPYNYDPIENGMLNFV